MSNPLPPSTTEQHTTVIRTAGPATNAKSLEQRFNEQMDTIYGKYGLKEDSNTVDYIKSAIIKEPYIEVKPNSALRRQHGSVFDVGEAALGTNVGAIAIDALRMGQWSINNMVWYLDQQVLQSGNTFTETRTVNPLFIVGNTVPYLHLNRSTKNASTMDLVGDGPHPGSTTKIGAAGRIQKLTSKDTVARINGVRGSIMSNLARLLPPNRVSNTIGMISNMKDVKGPLEIGQRPEMDMRGNRTFDSLYSIHKWIELAYDGFVRTPPRQYAQFFEEYSGQPSDEYTEVDTTNTEQRSSAEDAPALAGKRYFITGIKKALEDSNKPNFAVMGGVSEDLPADRYMRDSVIPHPAIGGYELTTTNLKIGYNLPWIFEAPIYRLTDRLTIIELTPQQQVLAEESRAARAITTGNTIGAATLANSQGSQRYGAASQPTGNYYIGSNLELTNPGETGMLFGKLSLRQQYENINATVHPLGRIDEIRIAILNQKTNWLGSIGNIGSVYRGAGYQGGQPINGTEAGVNPHSKDTLTDVYIEDNGNRQYFFDPLNSAPAWEIPGYNSITGTEMDRHKITDGTPLVDLYLYDFVNRVALPFRANILNFSETVSPEFTDNFYIGRTERNIVYTGVRREMSLSWMIHAYNEVELSGIWAKLNYLTSLCYPSQYSRGFMVPPLIKLTLGDVYNNQPGYIKSLSYTIDQDTPWEVTEKFQVPHGVTVNMAYSIIEKIAQSSDKYIGYDPVTSTDVVPLYAYGQPRSAAVRPPPPRRSREVGSGRCVATTPRIVSRAAAFDTVTVAASSNAPPAQTSAQRQAQAAAAGNR